MYGAVPFAPVIVMFGEVPFKHTAVLSTEIVAVGNGFTSNVADPDSCGEDVLIHPVVTSVTFVRD